MQADMPLASALQPAAITGLLTEIAAVADRLGDADAAERVRSEAGAVASHSARVVVVGEKKRGKSSLINALLRRPDLLPVDADIATSVHISVHAADAEEATVVDDNDPAGRQISLAEIGEYAALDPATMEMRHPGVREVSVGLPDPLLRAGIELIDTPGVGGLVSGHADLTLAALSMADALVFVVNGSSELTASELAFLVRATERVETVVFVLTQTDKYPKWREVLAADRRLAAEHAPQFASAPWLPVSSRQRLDAVRAAAAGDADRAARLGERSKFEALEQLLTEQISGRADELRAINAARVARRVLDIVTAAQERRLRSLTKDPGLTAAVAEQRARLAECRRGDAAWRRRLDQGFRELARQMQREYTRRITELQEHGEGWAREADTSTVTQVAHDFDAGTQAMWVDLSSLVEDGALRIAAQAAADVGDTGVESLDADMPYPEQLEELPEFEVSEEQREGGWSGALRRYWPALPGVSMTSMAAHLLFAAVNPFAIIGVGGLVAAALLKSGKQQAGTSHAREQVYHYIQTAMNHIRVEVPAALQDGMEGYQSAISELIADRIGARDRELGTALDEAARHLQESEEQLAPRRAAAEQDLRQLRELAARAEQLGPRPYRLRARAEG